MSAIFADIKTPYIDTLTTKRVSFPRRQGKHFSRRVHQA